MDKEPDMVRQHPAIYDAPENTPASRRDQLLAVGRLMPARNRLTELGAPPDEPHEVSISEALSELRSSA